MKIVERFLDYLARMLGIDALLEQLAQHTAQNDILISQNDRLLDAFQAIRIGTLIEQSHKVITAIGNTPSATVQAQKELGIIPQTAICSICGAHVVRFTVIDGQFVCANHPKG